MRPIDTSEDLAGLRELFEACALADGHAPVGEHKYLSLLRGEASSVALVDQSGGRLVSYLHLLPNRDEGGWTFESAVDPAYRTEERLTRVARRAMREASDRGAVTLRTWVYSAAWPAPLTALGFRPDRELRQLRVGLPMGPADYPDHLDIRSFVEGRDENQWFDLNNLAFAGHPENGSWDLATLADRKAQAWWNPDAVVMAWQGDQLVGFCWTKDHGDGLGEIYIIAVHPDHRRRGLGKALTVDGLRRLHRRGCTVGMLYVDAANREALALYESLGFTLHHIDQSMIVHL